jgi:hypothetical protein
MNGSGSPLLRARLRTHEEDSRGATVLDAWAMDGVWMRRARTAQLGLRGLLNREVRRILALENGAARSEASHPPPTIFDYQGQVGVAFSH